MIAAAFACLSLFIWLYLVLARGGFWRAPLHILKVDISQVPPRRIAVVIPARNEAEVVHAPVFSLLTQDFPSPLHVFLVDDWSSDGTAAAARAAAERAGTLERLTILQAVPLPSGWTGKMWAIAQGVSRALAIDPDYVLFSDADIRHGERSVAELVSIAEAGKYDLVSYMVRLASDTIAEKALIPAFVFFFLMLYPPAWISSRASRTAGAAGGCILIRPVTLRRIGGIEAIRNEVIDDCALAAAVKRTGGSLWMGLTRETQSIRSYGGFHEIRRMISRTAFNQLRHSTLLLLATIIGLCITYLAPPLLILSRRPGAMIMGGTAWALMTAAYLPMVRFYKRSFLWPVLLPAIAAFYLFATVDSAVRYWRGVGGVWKGRAQDVS